MRFDYQHPSMIRSVAVTLFLGLAIGLGQAAAGPGDPVAARTADHHPNLAALAAPPANWRQTGSTTTVAGEALFNVINGGAEMYLQKGFRQAVFNSFQNPEGLTINLEIYEMIDPGAARAIFEQKAGESGLKAPYGQDARLAAYYLNFRRGRYQVTVSGYTATPETVTAIRTVAATVDKRLKEG